MRLTLSTRATQRLTEMLKNKGQPLYLRIIVHHDKAYEFKLERTTDPYDQIVESGGLSLVLDPQAAAYLDGARIDWVQTPQGQGFGIYRPEELEAE